MTSTESFYTTQVAQNRSHYFAKNTGSNNSTELFLNIAREYIASHNSLRILDLGTGNGFVAKELASTAANLNKSCNFIAIDLATAMLREAKDFCKDHPNILLEKRDNLATGLPDGEFDLLTAKNVTSLNFSEIYRLLKPGGLFVMKEYNAGKGLSEVVSLFPQRIRTTKPEKLIQMLVSNSWHEIHFKQMYFKTKMSLEDVKDILQTAPIIQNYDPSYDDIIIEEFYGKHQKKIITSDPFILYAYK